MTSSPDLRSMIAEIVRELVAESVTGAVREQVAVEPLSTTPVPAGQVRVESVRVTTDADLNRFARTLLATFENPKSRQDLRAGRLTFTLDALSRHDKSSAELPGHRIETGAVTERHVKEAAEQGRRLVLGRRAVLTPLARDKARALGIPIEKER